MKKLILFAPALFVAGCANTSVVKVATNEAIVTTSAAPACGPAGAAKVAQKMAAVETIKSGYDKFIVVGADADSTVRTVWVPGPTQTYGTATTFGNSTSFNATSYSTGSTFVTGSDKQKLHIRMFENGEPGSARALSARAMLGPKWQEAVNTPPRSCVD